MDENITIKQKVLDQGFYSTSEDVPNQELTSIERFLSVIVATSSVSSGVRTESSEIEIPPELKGKNFKITDIHIAAISSTAGVFAVGDNLLVGLIVGGKSLFLGTKQTFNGKTLSLDMLPVPLATYIAATNIACRKAQYSLLSELYSNIQKLKVVYSHKSTNAVHYLIQITIGGVIL